MSDIDFLQLPKMCAKHEMLTGRYDPTCADCRNANNAEH